MKTLAGVLALAVLALSRPAAAQDGNKWKPYQFKGSERYEYKMTTLDGDEKKECVYVLEVKKKGAEDWELATTVRNGVKTAQLGAEHILGGGFGAMSPVLYLMNPLYGAFIEQVELKDGEKMSLFGAGVIKVGAKETVGGRSGFNCKLTTKQDDKDQLTWEWTVDPDLALPIKSVSYEGGKEKTRVELVSYKKD
ncbi:MAG: hypothetical protein JO332_16735 [Planctomycetaceae bacterium]|nr:hypothetical protein [Planctomycetaceae bacterium]